MKPGTEVHCSRADVGADGPWGTLVTGRPSLREYHLTGKKVPHVLLDLTEGGRAWLPVEELFVVVPDPSGTDKHLSLGAFECRA